MRATIETVAAAVRAHGARCSMEPHANALSSSDGSLNDRHRKPDIVSLGLGSQKNFDRFMAALTQAEGHEARMPYVADFKTMIAKANLADEAFDEALLGSTALRRFVSIDRGVLVHTVIMSCWSFLRRRGRDLTNGQSAGAADENKITTRNARFSERQAFDSYRRYLRRAG